MAKKVSRSKPAKYVKLTPAKKLKNSKGTKTTLTHKASQKKSGSDKSTDKRVAALPAGRRVSASGNVYYERRQNRSDKGKKL